MEIGSGDAPTPGYCHLDLDPGKPHVEIHADASSIPLHDGAVERILSIHLLEHFHQFDVIRVLCEWWRILTPGGEIEIHVPDFAVVSRAFLDEVDVSKKQLVSHTILGLHEHKSIFDEALLRTCMEAVGFVDVHRIAGEDRHDIGWAHLIAEPWSMKLAGRKPV